MASASAHSPSKKSDHRAHREVCFIGHFARLEYEMDLYIKITDEKGFMLEYINIWQDGSDREGASEIKDWLDENYVTDPTTVTSD